MKEYGQEFCPIVRASELIAERWTPIIIRNLLAGAETFSDIAAGAPGISETLLSQRLRNLERYGILERLPNVSGRGSIYRLTAAGRDLQRVTRALGVWGARWLEAAPRNLDPGVLLWAITKTMNRSHLPEKRIIARFDLQDVNENFWLVVHRPEPELCRKHPGFDESVVIETETDCLADWHMGRVSLDNLIRDHRIRMMGVPKVIRTLKLCLRPSPFAVVSRSSNEMAGESMRVNG